MQGNDVSAGSVKRRRDRAGSQVTGLVERIRALVAEQRDLLRKGCTERAQAVEAEIERLKWKLAGAVRRELNETAAAVP
jgi:hypothetical protein